MKKYSSIVFSMNLLLWSFVFLICIFFPDKLFSQKTKPNSSVTLSTKDTFEFSFQITQFLIPKFEYTLNLISNAETGANLTTRIIENTLNDTRVKSNNRMFFSENSMIENDLFIGADTILPTQDLPFDEYLKQFSSQVIKSANEDENTVSIEILNLSSIKKTSYFFYKVYTRVTYHNKLKNGHLLPPFERLFEIRLSQDSLSWQYQISTIRFTRISDYDTLNDYKNIIKVDVDPKKILNELLSENEKQRQIEKREIRRLTQEADDAMKEGKFESARDKYREAYIIDPKDRQTRNNLESARHAIDEKRKKDALEKELLEKITQYKSKIREYKINCEFEKAKILCDSLLIDFQVKEDEFLNYHRELGELGAAIASFETARGLKLLKTAETLFDSEIKKKYASDNLYKSELYYQLALTIAKIEPTDEKKILRNLDESIKLSADKNQRSLRLRSIILFRKGEMVKALNDASKLIENNPRDPEGYQHRAELYKSNNLVVNAIQDYTKAIELHSNDTNLFLNKAILEYGQSLFSDAETTCSQGINRTICFGELYFWRLKSRVNTNKFLEAGSDYKKALLCNNSLEYRRYMMQFIDSTISKGNDYFTSGRLIDARNEFSKAIDLDSSLIGLLKRGETQYEMKNYDLALNDLNILVRKNKNIKGTFIARGKIFYQKQMYYESAKEFETELTLTPDNVVALYFLGLCKMAQNKFSDAVDCFRKSDAISKSDSARFNMAWSNFYQGKFEEAVKNGENAIDASKVKRWESYYVTARANYMKGDYKHAESLYSEAIKINPNNKELKLWAGFNYEAGKDYEKAINEYAKVISESALRDTSVFRSAICLIKTEKPDNLKEAEKKLKNFENISELSYNELANMWLAYIMILRKDFNSAESYLQKIKESKQNQGFYYFIFSCLKAQTNSDKEALEYIEKAIKTKEIDKEMLEKESLLRNVRGKEMRILLNKYFP